MGRQIEANAQRLRRCARMLVHDTDAADALVIETLGLSEDPSDLERLLVLLIARRRARERRGIAAIQARPVAHHLDLLRAVEALALPDREVLALVVVEQLSYGDAARILDISPEVLMARLVQARTALARLADGERHVVLRLVK
jgi:predicted DNA-binding protein (UPF0251 family)